MISLAEVNILRLTLKPLAPIVGACHQAKKMVLRFFQFPENPACAELAKLIWLVRLRWLGIVLSFLLAAPGLGTGFLRRETMVIYLGLVGVVLLFNLFTHLTVAQSQRGISPFWICFQLAFDLATVTAILGITGTVANPFFALFFLNVALGGLLIPGRLSWPFLSLAHIFLGLLQFQEAIRDLEAADARLLGSFAIFHFLILSFWLVMRSLGTLLEQQFAREAQAKIIIEKQDRLRAIGALAAGFSHEFASPLNAAKIRLERAMREKPTEDLVEALEAVKTCEDIVRQMNSSQMDSRDFNFKKVVVAELLADIVESWRKQNPGTAVYMQTRDRTFGLVPPINFAQVILNLLDNAHEAAPGKDINICLYSELDHFKLRVTDQGPGFSPSVLARFGEPFLTTKPHGTGLGLYVSQLFCQSLGGALLLAQADKGTGACVRLEWPRMKGER